MGDSGGIVIAGRRYEQLPADLMPCQRCRRTRDIPRPLLHWDGHWAWRCPRGHGFTLNGLFDVDELGMLFQSSRVDVTHLPLTQVALEFAMAGVITLPWVTPDYLERAAASVVVRVVADRQHAQYAALMAAPPGSSNSVGYDLPGEDLRSA